METMNIALPPAMKSFVQEQVDEGGYSSASEYIRRLIREDQERKTRPGDRPQAVGGARQRIRCAVDRPGPGGIERTGEKTSPATFCPTITDTGIRMPRMQARPPMMRESNVMRSNMVAFSPHCLRQVLLRLLFGTAGQFGSRCLAGHGSGVSL
jgi:putative addiction module CopG family antidote